MPPFHYDSDGQDIRDDEGHKFLDMRGWGYLTGQGGKPHALDLPKAEAASIQDAAGEKVAHILSLVSGDTGEAMEAFLQDVPGATYLDTKDARNFLRTFMRWARK